MNIGTAYAEVVTFDFTGRLTVFNPSGELIRDPSSTGAIAGTDGAQVAISSQLSFNTNDAFGTAELVIAPFDFLAGGGVPNTFFHDISMQGIDGTYLVVNMLADFFTSTDIPISMVWDAAGMFGAFTLAPGGLQPGDVISGDVLKRNGNVIVGSIGSANPSTNGTFSDGFSNFTLDQGLAPLAVTTLDTISTCIPSSPGSGDCLGTTGAYAIGGNDGIPGSPMIDGPFPGITVAFDIGSGNSMTVLSVSSVPVPAALWLFGSGLLGLIGISKRKK
jgi:hypothetical protein